MERERESHHLTWYSGVYSSGGVDVGDHPPITPMRSASRDQLRDSEWRLYDFVTRHFLASVSSEMMIHAVGPSSLPPSLPPSLPQLMGECRYKMTEVKVAIGTEVFHWSGATPTFPGFTAVYPWQEVHGMETNVDWKQGQTWNVEQVWEVICDFCP